MDFLQKYQARLCFRNAELIIEGHHLQCQDEEGQPLISRVQALGTHTIPPHSEKIIPGRLTRPLHSAHYAIEAGSAARSFLVATTLAPGNQTKTLIRILNPKHCTSPRGK